MEIEKELKELKEEIQKHNSKYYVEDNPSISDYEYDQLMMRLKEIEKAHPELIEPNSPTQRVGGTPLSIFEQKPHAVKMDSLQDVFSVEDLYEFEDRIKRAGFSPEYVVEAKIDGLSIAVEYRNGELFSALTRGDGMIGEDVTLNVKTIKSLPLKISNAPSRLIIRGEVYMPFSVFEKINAKRENEELPPLANPRNAAAGSLRQLDPKIAAERELDAIFFNIQLIEGKSLNTHTEALEYLKQLGFRTSPYCNVYTNINDVYKEITRIGENRESLGFTIDGAVVKLNSFTQRETLGQTSKYPRWAIAYKYPAERKETQILDIVVQVGRTGVLTPNALLKPVLISGSTVSRATLNNRDYIAEKDIRIGDTVLVQKAGEIIPEIVQVNFSKRPKDSTPYRMPEICPACGAMALSEEGEAAVRCQNSACPAQKTRTIIHFASRDAMNIEGLGPAVVEQLIQNGLIENSADLYFLQLDPIAQIERMGTKSATNLLNAIEKTKSNELYRLIFALGIRQVGVRTAKLLAAHFKTMDAFENTTADELVGISEIGQVTAHSILNYFSEKKNIELIEKLKSAQVNMNHTQEASDLRFDGKTFVLTGTLEKLTRGEATEIIEKFGGKVSGSVSKKTDFCVYGPEAGSKLQKARDLSIPLVDEDAFFEMIK